MRRRTMFAVVVTLIVALSAATTARADYLEVRRNAMLKVSARADAATLLQLKPGVRLELVSPKQQNGYYRAKSSAAGGRTGWVYRALVRRYPGVAPANARRREEDEEEPDGIDVA